MPVFSEPGPLQSGQKDLLYEAAERFEEAWKPVSLGGNVDLAAFLPATGEGIVRTAILHELIKTDLEIRWRRDQRILLEEYAHRFPELGTVEALSPRLVYEEYRARQMYGDRPGLDEYRRRFPAQFAELSALIQKNPLTGPPAPDPESGSGTGPGAVTLEKEQVTAIAPKEPPQPDITAGLGYKLIEPLRDASGRVARGAFGVVWRAEAPGGVVVAVKIINSSPGEASADDSSPFAQEKDALELIKNLKCPCLVKPNAFWVEEGRLHIAMDLADGSLLDQMRASPEGLPQKELLPYFRDVAEALDFLHEQNLRHRDVKPANVLLYQGHAKLADFSLTREAQCTIFGPEVFGGTAPYMAPEVWDGSLSRHSDQFSLAVSYAHLRLARTPFRGKGPAEIMQSILKEEPNLAELPKPEQRVLRKALAKDPHQRFPNCRDFVAALQAAADEAARPPPPRRRPILAVVTALAALGLLSWSVWSLLPEPRVLFLPPGFKGLKDGKDWVVQDEDGRWYYRRIAWVLSPQGPEVEFILIPRGPYQYWGWGGKNGDEEVQLRDLRAFYIMKDKVSLGLYRRFDREFPGTIKDRRWEEKAEGRKDDHPVLGVTGSDATAFARQYFNGKLPRLLQWDKASGRFIPYAKEKVKERPEGPYRGHWPRDGKPNRPRVAVGGLKGPLPLGEAVDDISPFGCRDMAGNGVELTRVLGKTTELRGARYSGERPFQFAFMEDPEENAFLGIVDPEDPYANNERPGFRVVIEVP